MKNFLITTNIVILWKHRLIKGRKQNRHEINRPLFLVKNIDKAHHNFNEDAI